MNTVHPLFDDLLGVMFVSPVEAPDKVATLERWKRAGKPMLAEEPKSAREYQMLQEEMLYRGMIDKGKDARIAELEAQVPKEGWRVFRNQYVMDLQDDVWRLGARVKELEESRERTRQDVQPLMDYLVGADPVNAWGANVCDLALKKIKELEAKLGRIADALGK